MPVGLASSDRKLLFIGGALLVVLLAATVILSPSNEESGSRVPSTYSSESAGAQAAYLLLTRLHYPVRRWEESPIALDSDSGNALLILADPFQPPSKKEQEVLSDFVEGGGHVLFTGANIRMYFPDAPVSRVPPESDWRAVSPDMPNSLLGPAGHVALDPQAYWTRLSESQVALFGGPDFPVVVRWKLGDGEILWWAGSTPLTNAGITREDNLSFFLNSVANWSGEPYRIYWDEYFHGQRSSLWSYVGKTSISWGFLQLGLLAFALLFTFSRRSGPVFVPPGVSRLSPLEFVDTLGGLYERAGAASSAVSVSYVRLRALLTRQLGLPSNTPYEELANSTALRLGWKEAALGELLRRAEASGRMEKLKPREALELVRELEEISARLDVRSQLRREKN